MKKPIAFKLLSCCLTAILIVGCSNLEKAKTKPRMTLFVGIDVSGSFYNTPYFNDAIDFLSIYLYLHMKGIGGLKQPKNLFVTSIGAETKDDPRAFRPIHDFQDKTPEQIKANLLKWYPKSNFLTDFNVFFKKVETTVRKYNLVLAPTNIIILSDGIHDMKGNIQERDENIYKHISFEPLEYLARNVTVRLLYTTPKVADGWDRKIERRRVKVWTKEAEVMKGWRAQVQKNLPWEQQDRLFQWLKDNVDFRVRTRRFG